MRTQSNNEDQIRQYAYQLWESEGKPSGQEERHWCDACDHFKQQDKQQYQQHSKKTNQQQS